VPVHDALFLDDRAWSGSDQPVPAATAGGRRAWWLPIEHRLAFALASEALLGSGL
jgi:hypothetical protein